MWDCRNVWIIVKEFGVTLKISAIFFKANKQMVAGERRVVEKGLLFLGRFWHLREGVYLLRDKV